MFLRREGVYLPTGSLNIFFYCQEASPSEESGTFQHINQAVDPLPNAWFQSCFDLEIIPALSPGLYKYRMNDCEDHF